MKLKILLVDDASFIRDLIKRTLRTFLPQCEVTEASDGKRAQIILNKQNVDLILSDWEMPGLSGEELLVWVRAHEKQGKTPFIMISSLGGKEHIMRAVSAGVSDYLGKPFTAEELMHKVQKALARVGKLSPQSPTSTRSSGGAFSSVEIFSGKGETPLSGSADALMSKPVKEASADAAGGAKIKGTGLIKWEGQQLKCMIKAIDAEEISVVARRAELNPAILHTVQVDFSATNESARITSLPAYVQSISAIEKRPDAEFLSLVLRLQPDSDAERDQLQQFLMELSHAPA
jgi:CheY-like chemotaxis protein